LKLSKKTGHEVSDLQDKWTTLRRRIENWREVQLFYMPTALQVHESSQSSDERQRPESVDLRLPSGVPRNMWPTLAAGLIDKEKRLRVAQAHDGLAELRKMLRVTMGLWQYKRTQLGPSQRANTRARSMIERYREKVERCADRYRSARAALLALDPAGNWTHLRELHPKDVKLPGRSDEDKGEGVRELSWIWMTQKGDSEGATEAGEDEINDSESPKSYSCL
jgi:hypothetical protein